ncbi:MAG: alpha/beta fold hydrolase [Gammaproteobacteria bacterium]|nr:alpha/beta fold hydrolase [Gammaproteobacteria bacterium]
MKSVRIEFPGAQGQTLVGRLEQPVGPPRAHLLFAHCFTCTKNIRAAVNISQALAAEGFAVLRFDFTGLGESDGDFADTNFSSNVSDLVAAADFLRQHYQAPSVLVGHSLGGTAVLQAAQQIDEVVAVATIGSPARARHVENLFAEARPEIAARGEAEVRLAGRPFTIRQQFVDDLRAQPVPDTLRQLRKALLVMHSPVDTIVSIDNAAEIFQNALHPKSFVSLDDADHLLSSEADSRYAGQLLAAWASRYLPANDQPAEAVAEGTVRAVTGNGYLTELQAGVHAMVADEPAAVGGSNLGPTPYGLLSAALASCTSMTLRMYADHKKLNVNSIEVTVEDERVHAKDCAECETATGFAHRFERTIDIDGDITDQQRQRMLEIADRCPVHRTLEGEIIISSRLR